METTTHYKQIFSAPLLDGGAATAKAVFRVASYPTSGTAKFDDRTTTKEAFKEWKPSPSIRFQELPSFTGSARARTPLARPPSAATVAEAGRSC